MPEEEFEFTREQLLCLQELSEGWKPIWERICNELFEGNDGDGKGRIYYAASQFFSHDKYPNAPELRDWDIRSFLNFVFICYTNRLEAQTLFLKYNYDQYHNNIFGYFCAPEYLKKMHLSYCKEILPLEREIKEHYKKLHRRYCKKNCSLESETNKHDENNKVEPIEDLNEIADESVTYSNRQNISFLSFRLDVLPNAQGKFYQKDIVACLQLYPRIDYTYKNMLQLQESVHNYVAHRCNISDNEAQTKINEAHEIAKKRINSKRDALNNRIFNPETNQMLKVVPKTRQEVDLQRTECDKQEISRPLDASQIADLLQVQKETANQIIHRYREYLPTILVENENEEEI